MSATAAHAPSADRLAIAWHDLECGGYEVDLPLWRELAGRCRGAILDLGCGTGRVAFDLAGRGHRVLAVERDPLLANTARERAGERGLPLEVVREDVSALEVPAGAELALAPMQLLQLLDPPGRARLLGRLAAGLEPGSMVAAALAGPPDVDGPVPPLPGETIAVEGWTVGSTPTAVRRSPGRFAIERVRSAAPPQGRPLEIVCRMELHELSPDALEREASEAGLVPRGRREIPETHHYLGSTAVLLESPA